MVDPKFSLRTLSFKVRHLAFSAILFLAAYCLLSSCAQMVAPTGGPADKTPPKAVKYSPDSASLNFNRKQIRILFNEYIQLVDINKQLIISPPLKYFPDIRVKGKALVINIRDTLAPQTTYAFNFGNSIADLNERNALSNFQYIFSTGSFIDSVSLKGSVKNALTLIPEKDVLVMLYNTSDDSLPFRKLPNYFGKTKEDGSFRINNIRNGKYKVFALQDKNANYLYDTRDESIAFSDTLIDLQNKESVDLFLFNEGPKKQFIKKAKSIESGHLQFVFNKPVVDPSFTLITKSPEKRYHQFIELNTGSDSVNLWLPDYDKDSIRVIVASDNKVIDTLELAIPKRTDTDKKFKLTYKTNVLGSLDLNRDVVVKFNHYLDQPQNPVNDLIELFEDSIKSTAKDIVFLQEKSGLKIFKVTPGYDKNSNHSGSRPGQLLHEPWKENTKYKILIQPGVIQDIFGLKNDSIKIEFKTPELKTYGTLKLNWQLPSDLLGSVLQLLDDKDRVTREFTLKEKSGSVFMNYLIPQNYKLRLICDKNGNEKFDSGDYLKHRQPEKVIYYPGTMTIRANWDLEQEWKVGLKAGK